MACQGIPHYHFKRVALGVMRKTHTFEETEKYINDTLSTIAQIDRNEVPFTRQNFTILILKYLERLANEGQLLNLECAIERIAVFNQTNKRPVLKRTDLSKFVELAKKQSIKVN